MNLRCRSLGSRHYRDYSRTQSLSMHYEAEGRGWGWGWGCTSSQALFAAGLAIWLANLPLSIRVQTTLLELNVSCSWSRFEKPEKYICFFDGYIVVNQIECGLALSVYSCIILLSTTRNDMRHHSGQNLLWLCFLSPQHFGSCLM